MDEITPKQQTTSILELMYLIRAKNKGEISFAEFRKNALSWAVGVIAVYETGQANTAPSAMPSPSPEGGDEDGCQSGQCG